MRKSNRYEKSWLLIFSQHLWSNAEDTKTWRNTYLDSNQTTTIHTSIIYTINIWPIQQLEHRHKIQRFHSKLKSDIDTDLHPCIQAASINGHSHCGTNIITRLRFLHFIIFCLGSRVDIVACIDRRIQWLWLIVRDVPVRRRSFVIGNWFHRLGQFDTYLNFLKTFFYKYTNNNLDNIS